MVLLIWYNSLILSEDGSVKSLIATMELLGREIASLNPGNGTMGPLGQGNTVPNKGLMESLGRGDV